MRDGTVPFPPARVDLASHHISSGLLSTGERCKYSFMNESLSYKVDLSRKRVVVTYHASPSFEEWVCFMNGVFDHPDYREDFDVLLDRRAVPTTAETPCITHAVEFIDKRLRRGARGRWALVVSDLGNFGLGRMAEQLSDYYGCIRAFKNFEAAEEWLDQPGVFTPILGHAHA